MRRAVVSLRASYAVSPLLLRASGGSPPSNGSAGKGRASSLLGESGRSSRSLELMPCPKREPPVRGRREKSVGMLGGQASVQSSLAEVQVDDRSSEACELRVKVEKGERWPKLDGTRVWAERRALQRRRADAEGLSQKQRNGGARRKPSSRALSLPLLRDTKASHFRSSTSLHDLTCLIFLFTYERADPLCLPRDEHGMVDGAGSSRLEPPLCLHACSKVAVGVTLVSRGLRLRDLLLFRTRPAQQRALISR